jgi:shikimate dehydrogenase
MPPDRFAVIGDPIAHSLSPVMHMAALSDLGIAGSYEAIHVPPSQLAEVVESLRQGRYRGFNVTIPHKEHVGAFLDAIDPSARRIGAVNTVVNDGGQLTGYNTDAEGFTRALEHVAPDVRGGQAVVFGAGGSARAVIHALRAMRLNVTIVVRNPATAAPVALDYGGAIDIIPSHSPALASRVLGADLLINTTPLGMGHLADRSPLPNGLTPEPGTIAFDLVYGRLTPFLTQCREAGCDTLDGLEMLVYQGAASFKLWTGLAPDVDVMRDACLRALGEMAAC